MIIPELPFNPFPKISRLSREIICTEKIDGTNAGIYIDGSGQIFAASRSRWITPQNDNYCFARWVEWNKVELLKLGPGMHYGEWWGASIQRRYGLQERRFSLFNAQRWIYAEPFRLNDTQEILPACCHVVPVLYRGIFDTGAINDCITRLVHGGSVVAPGFKDAEGIVIFHVAAGVSFKKTVKDDESPKSLHAIQVMDTTM